MSAAQKRFVAPRNPRALCCDSCGRIVGFRGYGIDGWGVETFLEGTTAGYVEERARVEGHACVRINGAQRRLPLRRHPLACSDACEAVLLRDSSWPDYPVNEKAREDALWAAVDGAPSHEGSTPERRKPGVAGLRGR